MESSNQTPEIVNQAPLTDKQKSDALKSILFEQFNLQYRSLCEVITKTPFNPHMKRIISEHVDTAFLWAKEAFGVMNFEGATPPAPPVDNGAVKDDLVSDAA